MGTTRRIAAPLALTVLIGACAAAAFAAAADPQPAAPAKAAAIAWLGYQEGLARAKESKRPVLLAFTADWCKYCRKMKQETYTDAEVAAYLNENLVPVMVDTEKQRDVAGQYFVRSLPTIWFLDGEGNRIANLPGYVDAPTFLKVLKYIGTGSYKDTEFKAFMEKAT